jgi:prolyl 4-hydroxylase
VKEVRNNQRILLTDQALAEELWFKLKELMPQRLGNSLAIGLNELFRIYKYEPGQLFKKHRDQSFMRNESEASYFTFMIYLNDDFEGGDTTFNSITIKPATGTALIFFHDLEHEGSVLTSGVKYVLRTDVMYRLNIEN